MRREVDLGAVRSGQEEAALAAALAEIEAGDIVVYHRGIPGSCARSLMGAASRAYHRGLCLLVQRPTAPAGDGDRVVEYLAIKRGEE